MRPEGESTLGAWAASASSSILLGAYTLLIMLRSSRQVGEIDFVHPGQPSHPKFSKFQLHLVITGC